METNSKKAWKYGYIEARMKITDQPNYILLSPEGEILVPTHSYDLSVENFIKFLNSGVEANKK